MGATMGYAALSAVKSGKLPLPVKVAVLALCCALAVTANWNYIAVLWVVGFGLFYGNFRKQAVCFCVVGVLFHLIPTFFDFGLVHEGYPHWYQLGIFLAIPILALYNGRRGKKTKAGGWFFYVYYPAHLLVLYLVKLLSRAILPL